MSEKTDIIIRTEKLSKTFTNGRLETPVLFDIDLEIRRGEFVAIMGPSGCGKSTLMHILGLMLRPTSGTIRLDGRNTAELNESQRAGLRREKIGFIFQRFNLLPNLTARQNIAIAERIRGNRLDGQIMESLAAVDMAEKAHQKPGTLSIGQQQRVAIARAIAHRPAVIMADEPTGNLDSGNADKILELFRRINRQQGISLIMITHSLTAAQKADRIICMTDGRIEYV